MFSAQRELNKETMVPRSNKEMMLRLDNHLFKRIKSLRPDYITEYTDKTKRVVDIEWRTENFCQIYKIHPGSLKIHPDGDVSVNYDFDPRWCRHKFTFEVEEELRCAMCDKTLKTI